jgi:hypothetical protein
VNGERVELSFFDPGDVPQPRDKVKIEDVRIEPYADRWRIKISIDVTPFQERPSLEIRLTGPDSRLAAELSVIETMHRKMEFTMHIRGAASPEGAYRAEVDLYYEDRNAPQDRKSVEFEIS